MATRPGNYQSAKTKAQGLQLNSLPPIQMDWGELPLEHKAQAVRRLPHRGTPATAARCLDALVVLSICRTEIRIRGRKRIRILPPAKTGSVVSRAVVAAFVFAGLLALALWMLALIAAFTPSGPV
jgi:hypothetical protein